MLEEIYVEETSRDAEQNIGDAEATIPIEAVLQLVYQLEQADMLKTAFTPPGKWILQSEVSDAELVGALHDTLSKKGWRRMVEMMHRHNRQTGGPLWDLAQPTDFLATVEAVLSQQDGVSKGTPSRDDHLAPSLWRQVRSLMQAQLMPVETTDWLLSPRAFVDRLNARARRAQTETQIESAASEAALYAARMVGADTGRDVALRRVEQLRERLGDHLQIFCEENDLPLPRPYSREEAYCLHLLNAYFVALTEAEDVIAKRGAALAKRQINLEGEWAEVRTDSRLLPGLLESRREINPLRESLFRERARHRLALLVGGVVGAIGGSLWGAVESISEVLIAGIARQALVVAPALLIGLMTLVAQTLAYSGLFTLGVVAEFLMRALWNGALALGTTTLIYGCWLYYVVLKSRASHANPPGLDAQFQVPSSDSDGYSQIY